MIVLGFWKLYLGESCIMPSWKPSNSYLLKKKKPLFAHATFLDLALGLTSEGWRDLRALLEQYQFVRSSHTVLCSDYR